VLCVLGTALALVSAQRADSPAPPPSRADAPARAATSADAAARARSAGRLLGRLSRTLEHGTAAQVAGLAATGDESARGELVRLRANVRALRVTGLSLRYLTAGSGGPGPAGVAGQRRPGARTWVGDVLVRWRLRGYETAAAARGSRLEVPVTFRSTRGGVRFVTARRTHGRAVPLWLLAPVTATRTARALVVSAGRVPAATVHRISRLADRAVVDVRRVLPRWRGPLVVEVPAGQRGLGRVLGTAADAYDEIAAVTTTADGSGSPAAPVHVFVNPPVFDPLGPRASQIVMSHEATHVAVDAAVSSMPTWLLEGFADYVALAHAGLPVAVTASQVLARVRRQGPPAHLPDRRDFGVRTPSLGASYEAAWLACRLLAATYGEHRLVAFYRTADRDSSTTRAFHALGTDPASFTRLWRRDLRRLAG